jgi:hypothetical protein
VRYSRVSAQVGTQSTTAIQVSVQEANFHAAAWCDAAAAANLQVLT